MIYAFGEFELDLQRWELRNNGTSLGAPPKVMQVLAALLARRDRVVSNTELFDLVWPGVKVTEASVMKAVKTARRLLGDDGDAQRMIRTVRGRGYMFVADVQERRRSSLPPRRTEPPLPHAAEAAEEQGTAEQLVGRQRELRELRELLGHGPIDRPRIVVVSGEAGIGKTRLLQAFAWAAEAEGARVALGHACEEGGAPELWPWIQILRQLRDGGALAEAEPATAQALAILPESQSSPERGPVEEAPEADARARFRLFDAIARALHRAAESAPLVIVLEDLHTTDSTSLRLLRFLSRELHSARVLLVGSCRQLPAGSAPQPDPLVTLLSESRLLPMGRLGAPETAELVRAALGTDTAADVSEDVHRMTEGNPLFVMEVVRFLARAGRPARIVLDSGEVPRGITESVRARLSALPEATRQLLAVASVVGREFDLAVLRRVTALPLETLMHTLTGATATGLVGPVPASLGVYRFVHGLFRDAAYDLIEVMERADLHRQVGEAIESFTVPGSEPPAAQLAHHFLRAALGTGSAKAVAHSLAASRHARRALAFDDAAAHAERALVSLRSEPSLEPRRFDALLALGEALTLTGDFGRARSSFSEAFALAKAAHDPVRAASAALGYARVKPESGTTHGDVVEILSEAAHLLEGAGVAEDPAALDQRALVLARISASLAVTGMSQAALDRSTEALSIARTNGRPQTLARALLARHWALWRPGTAGERLEVAREIIALERTLGEGDLALDARIGQITDLLELGRPDAFGTALAEYRRIAESTRDPLALWNARVFETTHAVLAGHLEEAERLAEETLPIGSRIQEETAQMFYAAQLWAIRLEQGRAEEIEPLSRALLFTQPDNVSFRGALLRVLAETGAKEAAREELERLLPDGAPDLPCDWLFLPTLAHASVATWVVGDSARAERVERALLPFDGTHAVVGPAILYLGPVSLYLGVCALARGTWSAAVERLERAVVETDRLGAVPTSSRTRCLLGSALIRRGLPGDVARAEELLAESQRASEERKLTANLSRCDALRRELELERA